MLLRRFSAVTVLLALALTPVGFASADLIYDPVVTVVGAGKYSCPARLPHFDLHL